MKKSFTVICEITLVLLIFNALLFNVGTSSTSEGETFTINISVSKIVDLYAWQAELTVNPTLLKFIKVEEGPFLKQGGTTIWMKPNSRKNTAGIVGIFGCSLVGAVSGVSGSGILATITVQVIGRGMPRLDLMNVRLLDSNGFEIPITLDNDSLNTVIIRGLDSSCTDGMLNSWKRWDFDRANTWGDFAVIDEDSAELVIGVYEWPDAELKDLIAKNGGKLIDEVSIGNKIEAIVADIPFGTLSSFVTKVQAAGLAKYVEPNLLGQLNFVPNDPYWYEQWGPQRIEADWAWNTTRGDPSIRVAVIDTGIQYYHIDLSDNYVPGGRDWVDNDEDPMDEWVDDGHGTMVAGIIAAKTNNSEGIAGLAQVRIMAERAATMAVNGFYPEQVAKAIDHAVKNMSARILNLSLSFNYSSSVLYAAIKYAFDNGTLLVASAGKYGTNEPVYPAAYDEVIAVTAINSSDLILKSSHYGNWVEVTAPGVNIRTTVGCRDQEPPGGYLQGYWMDGITGTSFAAPHVAGTAALVWSRFRNMTRNQVRLQLRHNAKDLGDFGFDQYYGWGRIDARKSVSKIVADANDDGKVNDVDMAILQSAWGAEKGDPNYDPRADFNHDNKVNYQDLYILAQFWGYGT